MRTVSLLLSSTADETDGGTAGQIKKKEEIIINYGEKFFHDYSERDEVEIEEEL